MGNICSKSASDSETHVMEDTCPKGESSSMEHMDSQLTQNQIVRLAAAISADNMVAIAEGYMDISPETVKNIRSDASSSEPFIRDIIRHWAYRNPENQLQKLAALLYKAASDCSYVDPRKVEGILGVASKMAPASRKCLRQSQDDAVLVTEEEFLDLAENLRPWTEKAMKIEVAPWIKEYVADMDDLYTELILKKIHNKPTGYYRRRINNYEELFVFLESEEDQGKSMLSRVPGKKILIKADPGMGKTTLVKKIAWDWAKKLFTKVSIVYFVFLKLVKPGDSIESVIIDQTPELEGLGVTKENLNRMLERFGEKCLLILDGLDEHAFGKNQDVLEIVRHKKYLFCNVLLTSRPHSTRDIERYFDTIVSVEGFTRTEATKFALRIVPDAKKVEEILNFNPSDFRGGEYISLCNCPILLSFMCILVREDDIDLSSRKMPTGEIYARMVRCLYKKYLIRKGKEFKASRFADVLKLLGSLALKTLLSGNPFFKRTNVIREVGDDAFDYGLLIGHEDFRLIRDETADILITFAHRSIQEFLGSFCFIQKLTDGYTIDSLLGVNCEGPVFMVNPLFLHFCLWLLYCSEKYVSFQNRENACETLKSFILEQIDCAQMHISDIVRLYPAINFEQAVNEDDQLGMQFFGRVLEGIRKVKSLTLRIEDNLEWLLGNVRQTFDNLTMLKVCSKTYTSAFQGVTFDGLFQETLTMTLPQFTTSDFYDEYLNIVLTGEIYRSGMLEEVLKYFSFSKRRLAVYLYLQDSEETDLFHLLHKSLYKVHVLGVKHATLTIKQDIKHCPHLSHLSLVGRLTLDISVFTKLKKAFQCVNRPKLSHLNLAAATFDNVHLSFQLLPKWLCLSNLSLFGCELSDSDIKVLSILKTTSLVISGDRSVKLLQYALQGVTETSSGSRSFSSPLALALYELTRQGYRELIHFLGKKQFSHLTNLNLSMVRQENCCLASLKPDFIPQLEILRLERCITSLDNLKHLPEIVNSCKLRVLDISHSSGISGHLSVLMECCFPFLHTLVLSDCGLHSENLRSLTEAKVNDRLPELRHLDISHNIDNLDCLFSFECKWERLVYLNVRNDFGLKDYIHYLENYVRLGCLCSLQTLRFYVDSATRAFHSGERGTLWPNLTTLAIVSTLKDIEYALTYTRDAIKANSFPVLRRVCVVVKSNVFSDVKMDVLGDDWSDMSRARGSLLNYRHPDQNVQIRELNDTKFAEALYELKKLGVEVQVWFSGDEQFTKKAGVM